ncbi:MAG TPA: Arm DNA-binding domain-containing protein [Spongiibacteraceae bacterium]|jgi:hypothetical protein
MGTRITDRLIAALSPADKIVEVYDSQVKGFCLILRPSGVMSFAYRYRNADGKKQAFTLGKYGVITAVQARHLAELKSAEVKIGTDVQAEKKAQKARAEQARQQTLKVFFDELYKPYLLAHLKSGDQIAQLLETKFVHTWADKSLMGLDSRLITSWRNEQIQHKPQTRHR